MMQPAQPPDRAPESSQAGGSFCSPDDLLAIAGQLTIFEVLDGVWEDRPTLLLEWAPWDP